MKYQLIVVKVEDSVALVTFVHTFSFLTWCWSHPGRLSKTLGTFAAAIASCWRITNSWGLSMLLLLSCKVMMDCYCCCPIIVIAK